MERREDLTAEIDRNCEDYWEDRIDHATFTARQRAAWDRIDAAGLHADVLADLRDRP